MEEKTVDELELESGEKVTYYVKNGMLHVNVSDYGSKTTQLGSSSAQNLAKILAREIIRENKK